MTTISKTITVNVDVDIDMDDLLDDYSDVELATYDLMRVPEDVARHHQALFAAVERGDCAAAFAAAEQIAWAMYGKIIASKVAA